MTPKDFAFNVVKRLRDAGFEAYWAGGCVRDQILGATPKDYDVATSATPTEIRNVFKDRRTIDVGVSFGVVTVLGPRSAGQIEIATFRQDGSYSDGRRPDDVTFSSAQEDALRRDFTINGMFYDPIAEKVLDYVGGEADLQKGLIRCIGDAARRIDEDKLRMLRAVRFASRFCFQISADTLFAIQSHACEIQNVSAERIANEMRRILTHANRKKGLELLQDTNLRKWVLPEFESAATAKWKDAIEFCDSADTNNFRIVLACLMWPICDGAIEAVLELARRWKLSNQDRDVAASFIERERVIEHADRLNWPVVQRILIQSHATHAVHFAKLVCQFYDRAQAGIDLCEAKLKLPSHQLNPTALITGDDLKQIGIPAGPHFRDLLDAVRDQQLDQQISDRDSAIALATQLWNAKGK